MTLNPYSPPATSEASLALRQPTVAHRRIVVVCILVFIACLLWLVAFLVFDMVSQKDAWFAYTHWRTRVLFSAAVLLSLASAALLYGFRLLPGRPISGFVIGIVLATLILPVTAMNRGTVREIVSSNRFYGFFDTTKLYFSFAIPFIIGSAIASERTQKSTPEANT